MSRRNRIKLARRTPRVVALEVGLSVLACLILCQVATAGDRRKFCCGLISQLHWVRTQKILIISGPNIGGWSTIAPDPGTELTFYQFLSGHSSKCRRRLGIIKKLHLTVRNYSVLW